MERGRERRWYDLNCEVLSPLHISLGPDALLIPEQECDVEGQRTYVLDRPALIAELQARAMAAPARKPLTYRDILRDRNHPNYEMTRQLYQAGWIKLDDAVDEEVPQSAPASAGAPEWLELALRRPRELPAGGKTWRRPEGRHLVRYLLDGTPQSPQGRAWWESISRLPRTPEGAILLPGSGLKGTLRSLLAYAMAEQIGPERLPSPSANPKWAAQPLERATLAPHVGSSGNTPNYDAGRLLLVRDCGLDAETRARITPFGLRSHRGWRPFAAGTRQSAAAVEAIQPGARFQARVAVDDFLLQRGRDRRGEEIFAPFREVLRPDLGPLLAAGRAFAGRLLAADIDFYRDLNAEPAVSFSQQLAERLATLPDNATLLRLGWGAGRPSKTPFAVLLDKPLPRSRRLTVEPDGRPGLPFGWVLCTITPR